MKDKFRSRKALTIYGIAALSVSLLCVALRMVSTVFFFDYRIGYYQNGAIVPVISWVLPIIACVAAAVLFAVPALRLAPNEPADTKSVRICAAVTAFGFAFFSIVYIISLVNYMRIYSTLPFSYILGATASVCGFAFFLLKVTKRSGTLAYVLCGIMTVLWFALALVESYFDTFVQMNSPVKLVFQFACLGAMLLTVAEMRVGVDNSRTSLHLLSATLASILLPMSAFPSIICYYMGKMPATYTLLFYDAVCVTLSVFAVMRLVQMCFFAPLPEKIEEETDSEDSETVTETEVSQ